MSPPPDPAWPLGPRAHWDEFPMSPEHTRVRPQTMGFGSNPRLTQLFSHLRSSAPFQAPPPDWLSAV